MYVKSLKVYVQSLKVYVKSLKVYGKVAKKVREYDMIGKTQLTFPING